MAVKDQFSENMCKRKYARYLLDCEMNGTKPISYEEFKKAHC